MLILLLYGATLRISEALSLTLADVDLPASLLTIPGNSQDTAGTQARISAGPWGPIIIVAQGAFHRMGRDVVLTTLTPDTPRGEGTSSADYEFGLVCCITTAAVISATA
jgi:hypothetical protein